MNDIFTVIFLEQANTSEEMSKGLMNRDHLLPNQGMLFSVYPPQGIVLWMKDTFIPLDIIFIEHETIVKIIKNTKPNQTSEYYHSVVPVTDCIEANAGFTDINNIEVGDRVSFADISGINFSKLSTVLIITKPVQ